MRTWRRWPASSASPPPSRPRPTTDPPDRSRASPCPEPAGDAHHERPEPSILGIDEIALSSPTATGLVSMHPPGAPAVAPHTAPAAVAVSHRSRSAATDLGAPILLAAMSTRLA
jgi:hypothetical protein